jgi:hypothetical protein
MANARQPVTGLDILVALVVSVGLRGISKASTWLVVTNYPHMNASVSLDQRQPSTTPPSHSKPPSQKMCDVCSSRATSNTGIGTSMGVNHGRSCLDGSVCMRSNAARQRSSNRVIRQGVCMLPAAIQAFIPVIRCPQGGQVPSGGTGGGVGPWGGSQ